MPADAREQIRQLPSGKWQLRYYDKKEARHSGGAFPSQTAARAHYGDVIEPGLNGRPITRRDLRRARLLVELATRRRQGARPERRRPVTSAGSGACQPWGRGVAGAIPGTKRLGAVLARESPERR